MTLVKKRETKVVFTDLNDNATEERLPSFAGKYEIWGKSLFPLHGCEDTEFLISDHFDVESVFDTFEEALDEALKIPKEVFGELESIVIAHSFQVLDPEMGGYNCKEVPLLQVVGKNKFIVIEDRCEYD